jgi:hypothetical protein
MIANIILDKAVIAYGQVNKTDTNLTNPIAYQNIPPKKVHLGDIDIAYKTFGKGKPAVTHRWFWRLYGYGGIPQY